jgi:hypothetical protein
VFNVPEQLIASMLAQNQQDLTQEQAAEKLRSLPDIHYKETKK